ncbi:hypothetical protein F4860DRAFT_491803 [Xylaria cubensis]|nr:hypothetical protein F4860DRAFT_491803 [Xylaria cubensis]
MKPSRVFSQKGWRRSGAINVGITYTCVLLLLICFSVSISQPGANLILPTIIFEGPCTTSSTLSLFLHLLINTISGAILASSNFFMQVLSAPSREEIDRAHAWLRSLEIGVPSFKNLWHMSRFKLISWFIFLFSSVPIHFLFNSVVFRTDYLGSEWHLTISTEAFTEGAEFFPPGASLSPAGSPILVNTSDITYADDGDHIGQWLGYGHPVPLIQYWEASSIVRQNLSSVAKKAHNWTVLNVEDCQAQYISCNPRTTYDDVVVIVETGTSNSTGWTRSELFDFQPFSNLSSYWDSHVPPEGINSLWFSTQCRTERHVSVFGRKSDYCANTCLGALGALGMGSGLSHSRFDPDDVSQPQEPWLLTPFNGLESDWPPDRRYEFNHEFDTFRVSHCLAQPTQPTCKVGVSNALLLIVVGCVFIKAMQATIVVWKLPTASLVTPGDVIESFLSYPDSQTQGLCTLDTTDSERLEYGPRNRWTPGMHVLLPRMVQRPKRPGKQHRLASAITISAWARTYSILIGGFILLTVGLGFASVTTGNDYSYSFDLTNRIIPLSLRLDYFSSLLLANAPQLVFSLCYISFNALITRLQVEREWNSLSSKFQPLRVSYPMGEQVSSYRLQLPYRYSVPMIAISISLHWVVSNGLFLYIIEGGFVQYDFNMDHSTELPALFSVSNESFITLGYSPFFILVLFIASFVLIICSPGLVGLQKLNFKMVTGGCNSLVISAACHPSDLVMDQQATCEQRSHSLQRSIDLTRNAVHAEEPETTLLGIRTNTDAEERKPFKLAQRKLRWGAMALPRHLAECVKAVDGREVHHLGFGGAEDEICEPSDDHFYA